MSETTLIATLAAHIDELGGGWMPLQRIADWLGWSTCEQALYLDMLQTMLECAPWHVPCSSAHGGAVVDAGELRTRTRQLLHGRHGAA
ncbi:hypothetical protein [Bounagaea algeriensis]